MRAVIGYFAVLVLAVAAAALTLAVIAAISDPTLS